jgi:DNA-directed RNA polymerase specialized sigma24 family protein
MKRDRPGDDLRRLAVEASLQGMSYRKIAQRMGRSRGTINRCLASCGRMVRGRYHLNGLMAKALFTEQELGKARRALGRSLLDWP